MAERAPPVGKVSCCAPESIVGECSREDIDKTRLFSMVKMNCSFPQCDQSGFIHPECYQEIEEYLTRFIKCGTFSNTFKKESFRKFNLDYQHTREFIWKEKGMYGLIQKQLTCNCGKGYLKKDLVWPPSKFMRGKKKVGPTLSEATNQLPKQLMMSMIYTVTQMMNPFMDSLLVQKSQKKHPYQERKNSKIMSSI